MHVGPAGGENAALGEAPAPLTRDRVSQAPATAARLLQYASKASTHTPIVQYVHVHAEHNAMTKPLNATQQVGGKMVAPPHMQRVASLQMRRRVVQLPHGGEPQLVAHEQLCHVDVRHHAPMLDLLVQVEIVQHGGVHVQELQRARRHVDRERRPHAERRREQRQRRRGEVSRRRAAPARALCNGRPTRLLDSRRLFW